MSWWPRKRLPDFGLRFGRSLSAAFHAPALLLNILCADLIASGYALSVVIVRLAWLMIGGR